MVQVGVKAPDFSLKGIYQGRIKGYLAARDLFLSGLEFFFIAVRAALLGYLIGLVVQYFFPGIALPAGSLALIRMLPGAVLIAERPLNT